MIEFLNKHTLLIVHLMIWGMFVIPTLFFDFKLIKDDGGMIIFALLSIVTIIKDKKYF